MFRRDSGHLFGLRLHHVTLNTGHVAKHRLTRKKALAWGNKVPIDLIRTYSQVHMKKLLSGELVPMETLLAEPAPEFEGYFVRGLELAPTRHIFVLYGDPKANFCSVMNSTESMSYPETQLAIRLVIVRWSGGGRICSGIDARRRRWTLIPDSGIPDEWRRDVNRESLREAASVRRRSTRRRRNRDARGAWRCNHSLRHNAGSW